LVLGFGKAVSSGTPLLFCFRFSFWQTPWTRHLEAMEHHRVMTFPALEALPDFQHLFTLRHPIIDVSVDRAEALGRLERWHHDILQEDLSFDPAQIVTAEQVHGKNVAVVEGPQAVPVSATDGLVCGKPGLAIGIYVADCCAIYLADPVTGAFGLLHSGRKGTEQGITIEAIQTMEANFGTRPQNLIVQLSPCIRPPHFEVDFAAEIRRQAREAGVREQNIHDQGISTATDLNRFYSYRVEKGKTGRMLAVLARK
jgi:copper oxidase (laccase) domain-containing protein